MTTYKPNPNCLLEDMDGELLLYNPESAVTLHLNGPSMIVWQLCDGERTDQQIIEMVKEAYPQQAEQISGDVATVLADLHSQGALETVA